MNKINQFILSIMSLLICSFSAEAASNAQSASSSSSSSWKGNPSPGVTEQKYQIMKRDQIDNTDALAIPSDDSEVEDEEDINQMENHEVFSLPKSR
jgi:hypothetical protein